MSKKQKTSRKGRKHVTSSIHSGAALNIDHANDEATTFARPSDRAINLARSFIKRARTKATEAEREVQIADMIDAALRIDRASGQVSGIEQGKAETKRTTEAAILNGIVARVQISIDNGVTKAQTIVFSQIDALTLARYLERQGFLGLKLAPRDQARWVVDRATDGTMLAQQERG